MNDEPEDPESATDEPDDEAESVADAKLREQLQKQTAAYRAITDGIKWPTGLAKQLDAFNAIDFGKLDAFKAIDFGSLSGVGRLGEDFTKLEADRAAVIESMVGPASRIRADIEALTASTAGVFNMTPPKPGAEWGVSPALHDIVIGPPRSETLLEDVAGELGALADSSAELTRISGRQADLTVQLLEHQREEAAANARREEESARRERRANRWAVAGWVVATVVAVGSLVVGYLALQKP